MIVVSDTTPLISLMKIQRLELVNKLFGEIQVPDAVFHELVSNQRFSEESRLIKECSYIRRVEVLDKQAVSSLKATTGLDTGESEAIVLSNQIKADFLLMDEAKGRIIAQERNIRVMGTIGILMIAYKDSLLTKEEIFSCIDILKNNGRHISDALYNQLIEKLQK